MDTNTSQFQLDCIFSDGLVQVENGIRKIIHGIVMSKTALCIALANVKQKALYKQAGIGSFREYLSSERISLNYQTAHEYAKIGEAYLHYRDCLQMVDFQEECGLKKLLLLECALRNHDQNAVFLRLMDSSYREFKRFATEKRVVSARADYSDCSCFDSKIMQLKMEEDEECIILLPSGMEVVWFNDDVKKLLTPEMYSQLKRTVFTSVIEFLHQRSFATSKGNSPNCTISSEPDRDRQHAQHP